MERRWPWFLAIGLIVIFAFLAGIYLFKSRKPSLSIEKEISESQLEPPSEEVVVAVPPASGGVPGFQGNTGSATLGKLKLEEFKKVKGKVYPQVDLVLSFSQGGNRKWLTVSLIDKIDYRELREGVKDAVKKEDISVDGLDFEVGNRLDFVFKYIPAENPVSREAVGHLCELYKSGACWQAYERGFGNNPVDFSEYFNGLYQDSNTAVVDYGFLLPIELLAIP
jgi:hypothetical protein